MNTYILHHKKELIEEQIENVNHSGFFTDAEITQKLKGLNCQLEFLQAHLNIAEQSANAINAFEEFIETTNLEKKDLEALLEKIANNQNVIES